MRPRGCPIRPNCGVPWTGWTQWTVWMLSQCCRAGPRDIAEAAPAARPVLHGAEGRLPSGANSRCLYHLGGTLRTMSSHQVAQDPGNGRSRAGRGAGRIRRVCAGGLARCGDLALRGRGEGDARAGTRRARRPSNTWCAVAAGDDDRYNFAVSSGVACLATERYGSGGPPSSTRPPGSVEHMDVLPRWVATAQANLARWSARSWRAGAAGKCAR